MRDFKTYAAETPRSGHLPSTGDPMAAPIDLGARTLGEETPGNPLLASDPAQGPGGDAITERIRSPQNDSSVWEQLMHNLMLALGGPHV